MCSLCWPFTVTLLFLLTACRASGGRAGENLEVLLKTQTQALLDAVTLGDAAVWDRYLDPQLVYLSEAGEVETKASLLAQIKPPPGISGKIAISRFEVQRFGDTAVVLHVDEESGDYFGHPLHAQYMTTATW